MKSIVTGGAGFIGTNLVAHLLEKGDDVVVYDNLSRHGTERNVAWLNEKYGDQFRLVVGDVRAYGLLAETVTNADVLYHLAAQVAVTTSVSDPRTDFETNALGTLNVLEAVRERAPHAIVLYASTNKVYGEMSDVPVVERGSKYEYLELADGISETRSLDFHSPYGCSKGAGDQYVIDYARIYGLQTITFRQSCIYGCHQFGNEDQGWAAHFAISAVLDHPITIYGDGKQVRDLLYITDLLRAFDLAVGHIGTTAGRVYNIGGGPANKISLLGLIGLLERKLGKTIKYSFAPWRPGDQKVYVSGIKRAQEDFDWVPQVTVEDGVSQLLDWIAKNRSLFGDLQVDLQVEE